MCLSLSSFKIDCILLFFYKIFMIFKIIEHMFPVLDIINLKYCIKVYILAIWYIVYIAK